MTISMLVVVMILLLALVVMLPVTWGYLDRLDGIADPELGMMDEDGHDIG